MQEIIELIFLIYTVGVIGALILFAMNKIGIYTRKRRANR